jgi:7-cyano-7-deazaguanine synthase
MCSISGLFVRHPPDDLAPARLSRLATVIEAAADRGRDSCGYVGITPEGGVGLNREVGHPDDATAPLRAAGSTKPEALGFTAARAIINNNRAEPTTEYVEQKDPDSDVQPFPDPSGRYWVSHNGTIANDDELREAYDLDPVSEIDTAVLPCLLAATWDGSDEDLRDILVNEVVGSYALAVLDREHPDRLHLACNYKPLALMYDDHLGTLYFSSSERYLRASLPPDQDGLYAGGISTREIDPYTLTTITDEEIRTHSLAPPTPMPAFDSHASRHDESGSESARALVIASGGLDSTTVASQMLAEGYDVTLLHFSYRHRSEDSERAAVEKISNRLGVPLLVADTDVYDMIGGSALLAGNGDAASEEAAAIAGGEEGAEFAHEWVPARNLLMLSVATGIAEAQGYDVLALGNNLEEAGAFPDNEMAFIDCFADVLPYATAADAHVDVSMPVGNLMKHEIVGRGLDLGAPLDLTWSCYEDGELHCGECGPCFMRKTAFRINGAGEVIEYAN